MPFLRVPVLTLIVCLMAPQVHAVTGSATLTAACNGPPGSPVDCGYYQAVLGSITNSTLSDGKTIFEFLDQGFVVTFSVSGFAADPGASYITAIQVDCASPPNSMASSSAVYSYSASNGMASWSWSRANWCILRPSFRSLSVN
jgi:hypothetical protein